MGCKTLLNCIYKNNIKDIIQEIPTDTETESIIIDLYEIIIQKIYNDNFIIFDLENIDIFDIINYIDSDNIKSIKFEDIKNMLFIEYIDRSKNKLSVYFDNINKNYVVSKNSDNSLFTTIPDDHFYMINEYSTILKEYLPNYLINIVNNLLQILRSEQRKIHDMLNNNINIDIIKLCAFANDFYKIEILCNNFENDIIKNNKNININNNSEELFKILLDELIKEYKNIVTIILQKISKKILQNLNEEYFLHLFTKFWNNNDATIIVNTLNDYFDDILIWLKLNLHDEFIKIIINDILQQYVFYFNNTKNKKDIVLIIEKDKEIIKKYCYDNNWNNLYIDGFHNLDIMIYLFKSSKN